MKKWCGRIFTNMISGMLIWYGLVQGVMIASVVLSILYIMSILVIVLGAKSFEKISEDLVKSSLIDKNYYKVDSKVSEMTILDIYVSQVIDLLYVGLFIYFGSVWFSFLSITYFLGSIYLISEITNFKQVWSVKNARNS